MNVPLWSPEVLRSLNPKKLSDYLRENEWSEEEVIGDKASIWIKQARNEEEFEILLPLRLESPDFPLRVAEVFETLEIEEKRSKLSILNDLIDASQVAKLINREVLSLRLKFPDSKQTEAPAGNLGMVLASLQNTLTAIGQYTDGRPTVKGAIPQKIIEQTKLSVIGTFKGSFGIKLATSPPPKQEQMNLLEKPLAGRTLQEFLDLIRVSSDEEKLTHQLIKLKRRSVVNYERFLAASLIIDSDIHLDWGSPDPELGGSAELSHSTIATAIRIVSKTVPEDDTQYEIVGKLIGGNTRRKDFEIHDIYDGKKYTGEIADSAISEFDKTQFSQIYIASIEEVVEVKESTGEEIVKRKLLGIKPFVSSGQEINRPSRI